MPYELNQIKKKCNVCVLTETENKIICNSSQSEENVFSFIIIIIIVAVKNLPFPNSRIFKFKNYYAVQHKRTK